MGKIFSREGRRGGTGAALLLFAAAALVLLLVGLLTRLRAPGPVTERRYLVDPVGPVEGPVERFVWKRPEGAVRFYLELREQDGRLLWSESTADTTLPLPATLPLAGNRVYHWKISYTFQDGVSLETGDEAFQVVPPRREER